jgi:ribose-phosphate pyrophosphokinase
MSLAVAYFPDEAAPAERLARALGATSRPLTVHRFPDGETMPRIDPPAGEATVIYRSLDHPNEKLVDLLLAADAARRAGARRLFLVAPYFCYLRQDAVFGPGQPLSRDVIAPMIGARFDGVITVQAHLHRTTDLARTLGTAARNLWAVDALAAALPAYDQTPLIVGPDAESTPWAAAWAKRLKGEAVSLTKVREGDRKVTIDAPNLRFKGRPVLIIDDIASSGETLGQASELARRGGAASIDIAVVHALMSETATDRLERGGVRRIISTDSVRHSTNAAVLAPILADAVRQMIEGP